MGLLHSTTQPAAEQNSSFQMIAKTFKGLEDVLAQELTELGANDIQKERRAVSFTGDRSILYRANFCLRTASRILVPIAVFRASNADEVYEQAKNIDWSLFMDVHTTFSIDTTAFSDTFRNSLYVTYRVKDAIADFWMEREQKRPSIKITSPDLYLNVHIANETVTLSLDSSGESLHKRGYRAANTEAPINEALAAGMLLLAGWHGQSNFFDPMCGSGTLLIEAALIAQNIAPGIFRKEFAFEKWADFDKDLFESIYNDDSHERVFAHKIYGSDAGYYAVQTALKNIKSAGMQNLIEVRQIRLEELHLQGVADAPSTEGALVMINPPYGERLAHDKDIEHLYAEMGKALKFQFTGATAWIISSNEDALRCLSLKPTQKIRLLNGDLDCQFNRYDLFAGEHKEWKKDHPKEKHEDAAPARSKKSGTDRKPFRKSDNYKSDNHKPNEHSRYKLIEPDPDQRDRKPFDRKPFHKSDNYKSDNRTPNEHSRYKLIEPDPDQRDRKPFDRKPFRKSDERTDRKPFRKSDDRSDRKPFRKSDDRSGHKPFRKSDDGKFSERRSSFHSSSREPFKPRRNDSDSHSRL